MAPPRLPVGHRACIGSSSSGSDAAVAAGFLPATLASDTSGSIRILAALCGIAGLEAHLWTRKPLRRDSEFIHVRSCGPARVDLGRLRHPAPVGRAEQDSMVRLEACTTNRSCLD